MSELPENRNGVRIDGDVHPKELEAVTNINLLDAELSELGIKQATEQAELASILSEFTTVLVSPMRRTLETAHLLFKNTSYF